MKQLEERLKNPEVNDLDGFILLSDSGQGRTLRKQDESSSLRVGGDTQLLVNPDISFCIDANYYKGVGIESYLDKHRRQIVIEGDIG
jgi:hypothetical protein